MPKFSDPFAEAKTEPVEVAGKEVAKLAVTVKDDDGEYQCVGILSKDYPLIKNTVARDMGSNIMSRSDYEWRELKVLWDGKKFVQYFVTREPIAQIQTQMGGNGIHPLHLGLMMRNTYDGTGKYGLEIFGFDFVCTNQFISRNRFGYFAIYHHDSQTFKIDDAIENVSIGANNLLAIAPKFQEMTAIPLTTEIVVGARKNTKIPSSKWGSVLDRLAVEEATKFGLYSAMTYVTSHQLAGFSAIMIGESVTDYFLDTVNV